ncbi:hypothetical protein [Arthrobacter sp. UNC362MFTsu5.1]|uniref:hypothetical protein n=1 Tax=Arthrobacter sp. UNC362MFTsu5.1 TaxID=1449044 RepID=UPI0012DFD194|nr:hypothetical protein [Arthrobacter sp. UNC362MFTsu5.1]
MRNLDRNNPDVVERAMARYLVVRAAGFIEAVRDDVADLFATEKASGEVARRIRVHLRGGQGVTPEQLLTFVNSFHPSWHGELDALLSCEDNLLRGRIGAMVAARKKIAHGDGENVTTSRALAWTEAAEEVVKWLVKRFDPKQPASLPVSDTSNNPLT